jgi:hypothetical protein
MSAMFMENVRPLCKLQLIAAKILVSSYCWCPVTKQNVPTLSVICDILSFRPRRITVILCYLHAVLYGSF